MPDIAIEVIVTAGLIDKIGRGPRMSMQPQRWAFAALSSEPTRLRWATLCNGQRLPHREWLLALRDDGGARAALTDALRDAPFRAFLWETPVAMPDGDPLEAEMAITDSAALARSRPDPSSFDDAFRPDQQAATFANLSGDAVLVAPHPQHAPDAAHLAAFLRSAPPAIIDALWTAVGNAASDWLATRRRALWVSTSGLAVPWLHVRLDAAPKYYAHLPYKARR